MKRFKHLTFSGKFAGEILKGKKRATIRKRVNLKPGDLAFVHSGGEIIGIAKITSVEERKIEELTDEDAKLDGFESREEMMRELERLGYRGNVYLVKFEFEAIDERDPYEFHYGEMDLRGMAREALEKLELKEEDRRILELFLKCGSIRRAAVRLGGLEKRKKIRDVLRRCHKMLQKSLEDSSDRENV